jgi:hypothetical protein
MKAKNYRVFVKEPTAHSYTKYYDVLNSSRGRAWAAMEAVRMLSRDRDHEMDAIVCEMGAGAIRVLTHYRLKKDPNPWIIAFSDIGRYPISTMPTMTLSQRTCSKHSSMTSVVLSYHG